MATGIEKPKKMMPKGEFFSEIFISLMKEEKKPKTN